MPAITIEEFMPPPPIFRLAEKLKGYFYRCTIHLLVSVIVRSRHMLAIVVLPVEVFVFLHKNYLLAEQGSVQSHSPKASTVS